MPSLAVLACGVVVAARKNARAGVQQQDNVDILTRRAGESIDRRHVILSLPVIPLIVFACPVCRLFLVALPGLPSRSRLTE